MIPNEIETRGTREEKEKYDVRGTIVLKKKHETDAKDFLESINDSEIETRVNCVFIYILCNRKQRRFFAIEYLENLGT